jgi:triacylglycerol lipase
MEIRKKCAFAFALVAFATLSQAQTNPFEKGPAPTAASIAADGPFAVSSFTVARGNGFGGATVYVPTAAGQYALVAFCPGFTATKSSIAVMGRRLATHGFVVATIDTNSTSDQPPSRGTQLLAALNTIGALNNATINGKVDRNRRAVTGHSMGGGGTLFASRTDSTLKGGVPLAPWSSTKSFPTIVVPQAIIGGSADSIASVSSHSRPFYNSITQTEKLLAVISGASHTFPQANPANQPSSKYQIAWIKRFADNDTRYNQFLVTDSRLSQFLSTAPF